MTRRYPSAARARAQIARHADVTDDLIAFLRARLDEDEAGADADAFPPPGYADADRQARGFRGLAEVEAKRAMVDECERTLAHEDTGHWLAEFILQQLAQPYRDHPDYHESWKP